MSSAGSAPPGSGSSSDGSDPKGKRVREETRGVAIEKELRRAKVAKLKVQHDERTGKPVLKHGKMFLNLLAKLVRDTIPASTLAWKDVKKEDLDLIFERLDRKFDYPRDNVIFMDSIEQSMMHYLRDWRNNMKVHFITVGGKEALAAAKAKPYKNVPEDHWEILCDHFASQDFEKASSQNSENRSKQLYALGQGSLSIVGHIHKEGNSETGELMSPIDCFEERHFKNNSWRNDYTRQKHAEMVASREEALTQAQAQAHEIANPVHPTLSAESVVGPIAIDEYAIMTQSLGTRSRWQKGVGSLPRLKSVGGPRAASTSNVAAVQREHAETIASLKQQLAEKDAEHQRKLEEHQAETQRRLDEQQRLLQSLIAQLGNNGMNIQLSPPTQPPPPPPSQ